MFLLPKGANPKLPPTALHGCGPVAPQRPAGLQPSRLGDTLTSLMTYCAGWQRVCHGRGRGGGDSLVHREAVPVRRAQIG